MPAITKQHVDQEAYVKGVMDVVHELVKAYDSKSPINITKVKQSVSRKYKLSTTPKLVDIIAAVPDEYRPKLQPFLKSKPVRTASGIAVVAVMCKPHRCPHIDFTGNVCVYCPGGPDSDFEYSTQAYTGYEPTSMRAIRSRYDPYLQTRDRVEQLKSLGHSVDKVEFIVMGGTFLSMDPQYRDYFIRSLHDALSGHSSNSVEEAIQYSEQSNSKCIGITIETRPDYCLKPHLNSMLSYGCTRIEVGVQSIYEDVARDTNRGHTIAAVCHSFQLAKDCGYKVVAHLMPDLPNMGWERDLEGFREFFENPDFRSDGLKLYPTLVIRGTGLYELWKTGAYKNYPPETLVDLVARMLAMVPPWTRVYRIQRDIPMPLVTSGVEHGNLRELALARMRDLGLACRDVRTREVGIRDIHHRVRPDQVELIRRDYFANGGWETFLAYEDPQQDILVGLLRLRKCSTATFRPELKLPSKTATSTINHAQDGQKGTGKAGSKNLALKKLPGKRAGDKSQSVAASQKSRTKPGDNTSKKNPKFDLSPDWRERGLGGVSIVRELHVYGTAIPVHSRDPGKFQHQGFGTLLMEEAERLAKEEHGSDKLAVISGVGTRNYYRKLGYELDGPYMSKLLVTEEELTDEEGVNTPTQLV